MAKGSSKSKGKKGAGAKGTPRISRNLAAFAAVVTAAVGFASGYYVGKRAPSGGDDVLEPEPGSRGEERADLYRVPIGPSPSKGPSDALVTIVEFSDFECPHCSKAAKTVHEVMRRFGDSVRVVFKHNPLSIHSNAMLAAEASMAAHEQGKFWEYHDLLFESQEELAERGPVLLEDLAQRLELDMDRFGASLEAHRHRALIKADQDVLAGLDLRGTPMFFVNGKLIKGARSIEEFASLITIQKGRAERLLATGVPRGRLYEELVRGGIAPSPPERREAAARGPEAPAGPVEIPRNPEGPGLGPAKAPVHVVEFFDFQCPHCAKVPPDLHKLHEAFPRDVRVEFRQLPLPGHKASKALAQVALAAHAQGRYDQVSEAIFARQNDLLDRTPQEALDLALEVAGDVRGVDVAKLRADVESSRYAADVARDFELARQIGVSGTPAVYIDGQVARARSFEGLKREVERRLRPQQPAPPPPPPEATEHEAP